MLLGCNRTLCYTKECDNKIRNSFRPVSFFGRCCGAAALILNRFYPADLLVSFLASAIYEIFLCQMHFYHLLPLLLPCHHCYLIITITSPKHLHLALNCHHHYCHCQVQRDTRALYLLKVSLLRQLHCFSLWATLRLMY